LLEVNRGGNKIMERTNVCYVITHLSGDNLENERLIGVYSSKEAAGKGMGPLRDLAGFVDHPDGFRVDVLLACRVWELLDQRKELPGFVDHPEALTTDRNIIDRTFWAEGFLTE